MAKLLIGVSALLFGIASSSCSRSSTAPTTAVPPPVAFSVTGSAKSVQIRYTKPESIIITGDSQTLPFTYAWLTPPNQFQLIALTATITTVGNTGTVHVSVSENGVETGSDTAIAYPNTADVHYTHR